MAEQLCSTCDEPLLIQIEPDSDVEDSKAAAKVQTIPDDLELSCGCHYHWYLYVYTVMRCSNGV